MLKSCIITILISVFSFNSIAWSGQYYYIIKQNDYASAILHRAQLKPIYSKSGSLNSLRKANSKISDINKIYPGKRLYFSSRLAAQAKTAGIIQVLSTGEIVFNDENFKNTASENPVAENLASRVPESEPSSVAPESPELFNLGGSNSDDKSDMSNREPQSELTFALGMGFSRIDSTQNSGSAQFLSKAIPSALIQWQHNWSQSLKTHACWQMKSIDYEETDQGTLESGRKLSSSSLGFGATYVFQSGLHLKSEFGTTENVFATSASLGTAKLQTRPIPYFSASISKKLIEVYRLSFTAELGGHYLLSSSGRDFDAQSGSELFGKLGIEHKLRNTTVFVSGQLSKTNQNTSQSNQSTTDLKSQIGISVPLGGD